MKVFCAVPTMGTIADAQFYFWKTVEEKYKGKIDFVFPKQCVRVMFHDAARNRLVEEFLASDADILFFLDSDIVPPSDIFDLVLVQERWDCAGGVYPVFMTMPGSDGPQIVFTVYTARSERGLVAGNVPPTGHAYVDGVGTGCMFLKRAVLEKMEKPYFEFLYDKQTRSIREGEDLNFCTKIGDMGYKFYVDFTKVCKHYKNVCLLDVSNYAQEFAGNSIKQYDAMIRPKIDALTSALKKKKSSGLVDASGKKI